MAPSNCWMTLVLKGADGLRQYNGKTLHYVATCPNGWSDWQAAIEEVAAAGKAIGIDITTNYPDGTSTRPCSPTGRP